jgi:alpha-N-arabinofuranosidase
VIRWPGGCFADSYDWKDGIGPVGKRPRRTNFWAGDPLVRNQGNIPQKYDPNEFGTNEFVQFCKLAGSQPYLAAKLRSLPAVDFYRWVEYCNPRREHHAGHFAPLPEAKIHSTSATGALATNPGAAAEK